MTRHVAVRAVDSGGRPVRDVRIAIEIHQFAAGGMETEHTNSDGLAHFNLDVDQFAEISVYANGDQKVSRGSIQAQYTVTV